MPKIRITVDTVVRGTPYAAGETYEVEEIGDHAGVMIQYGQAEIVIEEVPDADQAASVLEPAPDAATGAEPPASPPLADAAPPEVAPAPEQAAPVAAPPETIPTPGDVVQGPPNPVVEQSA